MAVTPDAGRLLGRQRERAVLERLLDIARDGHGTVLVVHGDPGVGKTALLEYMVEAGEEFHVVRTAGVEGEMELDHAALQQLCSPLLGSSEHLPDPQRDALYVAFGLGAGPRPSPFLVALAVLGLLSEAAEQQPLLCIVDDAQWLDGASARALAFVARRLHAERIALVFAARDVGSGFARLPQLRVDPLGRRDARALLESALAARLDESVLERIIAETGGNPLALLELPRGLTPAQLAGGFGLPAAVPLSTGIEQSFTRRLSRLPRNARRLLLLAAAEPVGDPALLWHAAQQLGIPETAAHVVESEGLLTLDGAVVFRHPLVRSAVYGAAEPKARREAHRALADATDPQTDPDRRAWHRARAASVPDEELAGELERSAARAQARGGLAAAAAFLEGAVTLTREPSRRARRALAAAQTKFQAGALDDALSLLAIAEAGALSDLERARVALLRAQTAFVATRGSNAPPLLLAAARQLATLDPTLARETYLDALSAAMFAGRFAGPGGSVLEVAGAASAAPPPPAPRGSDLLLDALATLFSDTYESAVPILRRAQAAFGTDELATEQLRWLWLATIASVQLWDDTGWETLSERHVRLSRRTGALSDLPLALTQRVYMHLLAGELTAAASLVNEIEAATDAMGTTLAPYGKVGLAALRGREVEAAELIGRTRAEVTERGEGIGVSVVDWAEAVLYNGLARYEDARSAALRVVDLPDLNPSTWVMPELIEAAARAGTPELAVDTHRRLVDMTRVSGTDWALGLAARSEALLAEGQRAEALYVYAIERLNRTRVRADLARAHLLYGEWLRRERRRLDARRQLRTAHDLFSDFGMEAFAGRARVELEATGENARKRTVETRGDLTPQETQIARLARDGLSNAEIGARLFISTHTVEYHLRKVFAKLGINSRTKLAQALPPEPGAASFS
jgi:DNA-binding CsgD family transcriptional regulator